MKGDSLAQHQQSVGIHRPWALLRSACAQSKRKKAKLAQNSSALAVLRRSKLDTKLLSIRVTREQEFDIADANAHRRAVLCRVICRVQQTHKRFNFFCCMLGPAKLCLRLRHISKMASPSVLVPVANGRFHPFEFLRFPSHSHFLASAWSNSATQRRYRDSDYCGHTSSCRRSGFTRIPLRKLNLEKQRSCLPLCMRSK